MKLTTILLIATFFKIQANTYSQNTKLTLEFNQATVGQVFNYIEANSEFRFLFDSDQMDLKRTVSLHADNQTIDVILDQVFSGTKITYKINDRQIILTQKTTVHEDAISTIIPKTTRPQGFDVKGVVYDSNAVPLPGASIIEKGTSNGTQTDFDGNFMLTVSSSNAVLEVYYLGFLPQEIKINERNIINITMVDDVASLDEVVVVGYGTQKKRDVTGAVQTIQTDELEDIPVAQVTQKLQGKTSGVQILQNTGKPGEGMSVRIRGTASISASNTPLYVVDGFPIVGDISNINPDEIESISILKDAASTSLYGARASNGVVIITTKRGNYNETNVNVNMYRGIQTVPDKGRPDMMNAREFATFRKELAEETGNPLGSDSQYYNPESLGKGTDWYDVLLNDQALIENYSISTTARMGNLNSAIVAGYFSQEGVLKNSDYKRYSFRANNDFKVGDRITIGLNVAPTLTTSNSPNSDGVLWSGGIIESAILSSPLMPYINEDGSIPLTATGEGMFPNPNWYNVVQIVTNERKNLRLLSNAYIDVNILDGFNFKTSVSADLGYDKRMEFRPSTAGGIFAAPPRPSATGQLNKSEYLSWLNENMFTYDKVFGDHSINLLGGFTAQKYRMDSSYLSGTNYPDDLLRTIGAAINITGSDNISEWALFSWLGRASYNYKGKYLLTAAIRRDGSSRFGADNRWGNFPSVSAGWIVSDESFMLNADPISYLKFKGSYGITGNNNIGDYQYYAGMGNSNYVFNDVVVGVKSPSSLQNSKLGWERSQQTDLGFDLGLFKDRIFLQYNYYNKVTKDMLYEINVPVQSGFDEFITNIGEFKFWGHEITLSTKNISSDKLRWNTDFNIAFAKNEVVSLGPDDDRIISDTHITEVGKPIGQFYGYLQEGVYIDQEDFDNSPKHSTSQLGTVKYKDVNGDNIIDANDRTVIGNPTPDFIFGMTNSLYYNNWDFNMVISGAYGNEIMNRSIENVTNLDGVFNVTRDVADRWRSPENPGNGTMPRAGVGTALSRVVSSRYIDDGSYLTVKNITLGYTYKFKETDFFKSLRGYLSVQQALVLTNYNGANPEVSLNNNSALGLGIDWSVYPVPRTFTFGLNFNF